MKVGLALFIAANVIMFVMLPLNLWLTANGRPALLLLAGTAAVVVPMGLVGLWLMIRPHPRND